MLLNRNSRKLTVVVTLIASGILLTGCATNKPLTTFGGEAEGVGGACDVFPRPKYQVLGRTPYDQEFADKTTEAGVAGCKWQRPAARPPELDKAPVVASVPVSRKVSFWKRAKAKLKKRKLSE